MIEITVENKKHFFFSIVRSTPSFRQLPNWFWMCISTTLGLLSGSHHSASSADFITCHSEETTMAHCFFHCRLFLCCATWGQCSLHYLSHYVTVFLLQYNQHEWQGCTPWIWMDTLLPVKEKKKGFSLLYSFPTWVAWWPSDFHFHGSLIGDRIYVYVHMCVYLYVHILYVVYTHKSILKNDYMAISNIWYIFHTFRTKMKYINVNNHNNRKRFGEVLPGCA